VALRVYLVATDGAYKAMAGGLTRVAAANEWHTLSMQHGGASKDTWVLSDATVEAVTLLNAPGGGIELRRVGNNLPSRLADNFFWLGRYAERADATARLLRSAFSRSRRKTPPARCRRFLPFCKPSNCRPRGRIRIDRAGF
jgi:hypothetical protein